MGIRAVFYDLDGTLRISQPPGRQFFATQAGELGLQIDEATRRRAALWEHSYWAGSAELIADGEKFSDSEAFWANYSLRQVLVLGASTEQAEWMAERISVEMNENYHPQDVLLDELHETLAQLRQKGFTLGVISNREQPFGAYLQELGIGQYFDFVLAAGEINAWKPQKEIFLHALQLMKLDAHESLYVGDNYYADVVGARNAGMHPVLLDPEGLFINPGCPVIQSHKQILALIERIN